MCSAQVHDDSGAIASQQHERSRKSRRIVHEANVTTGNIWLQVLLYVLPLMAASLFQQLYTVVDAIVVGNFVGSTALGAVESTNHIVRLLVNLFIGISAGAGIVISQFWGARRDQELSQAVFAIFMFSLVAGVLLTIVGLSVSGPILRLMNTPAENWEFAYSFLMIYFTGMIPMMVYNMIAAIFRAMGDSRSPFYFVMLGTVVNIALDLLFVLVFEWGVPGAAAATVISEVLSALWACIRLMRLQNPCKLKLRGNHMNWHLLRRMVLLGLPSGATSALYPLSNNIVQWGVNGLGSTVVTGWALTGKVDMVIWLILDAFGVTTTTFVAQCCGSGLNERARKSVRVCLIMCAVMVIPVSILVYVWGADVARLFSSDPQALAVTDQLFKLLAPFYASFILVEVLSGGIRGTGETLWPMIITLVGTCVFRILWIALIVPIHWDIATVAVVYPISWMLTGLAFVAYWFWGSWRKRLYLSPDNL